jgi:predicted nucleic acid-binding protein
VIVVDASVAAKWYLPEPDSQRAFALLKSRDVLVAPDILRPEVASAITRAARTGRLTVQQARSAADSWLRHLEDELVALDAMEIDLDAAIDLALRIKHRLLDCLYLALAMRRAAPLITTDATLAQRAAALHGSVRML